jgi:Crp-like helix-turn-helix domain
MRQACSRYIQALIMQIAQNAVCTSSHATIARAARWLLTTRDRVGSEDFLLTQEFLGQMLGVRRPTTSGTARQLQAGGPIRVQPGQDHNHRWARARAGSLLLLPDHQGRIRPHHRGSRPGALTVRNRHPVRPGLRVTCSLAARSAACPICPRSARVAGRD